mgnify:CR=1 FL=1
MTRARIDGAAFGRRRKMQHDIGKTGNTPQTDGTIKICNNRTCAHSTPTNTLCRIAQESENAIVTKQAR